jgi:hypothetical protein
MVFSELKKNEQFEGMAFLFSFAHAMKFSPAFGRHCKCE